MPDKPYTSDAEILAMTRPLRPIEDMRGPLVYDVSSDGSNNGVLPQDNPWPNEYEENGDADDKR